MLAVQHFEADLYEYIDENLDAAELFLERRDGFLTWDDGLVIARLVMAAYMSAEKKKVVDLTNPAVSQELETYIPLIQPGKGGDGLFYSSFLAKQHVDYHDRFSSGGSTSISSP